MLGTGFYGRGEDGDGSDQPAWLGERRMSAEVDDNDDDAETHASDHASDMTSDDVDVEEIEVDEDEEEMDSGDERFSSSLLHSRFPRSSTPISRVNSLNHHEIWRPERLDILLEVFDAYAGGLRVLQMMSEGIVSRFEAWDARLRRRENRIGEAEVRRRLATDFARWQMRLCEREARLDAREEEFEGMTLRRLRDHLSQVTDWEIQTHERLHRIKNTT